jgi:hypothetical protein
MVQNKSKIADKDYENVRRALFQLPRRHAGQMKELAEATGINYGRLRRATSDVDTTREGRDLTLIEALRLMEASGDYSLLYAICSELGFETPHRSPENTGDNFGCGALMSETLSVASAIGILSATINEAVADSRVSENERRRILEALDSSQKELEKMRHLVMKVS